MRSNGLAAVAAYRPKACAAATTRALGPIPTTRAGYRVWAET